MATDNTSDQQPSSGFAATELRQPAYIQETCQVFAFLISFVLMGLTCAFGFAGNYLSVVTLGRDRSIRTSVTKFLLTVLAVSDMAFLVPVVIVIMIPSYCDYQPLRSTCATIVLQSIPYVRQYGWAAASAAHMCTVYITVLVAVHRYVYVCRPHDTERLSGLRRAKVHVAGAVLFAMLYSLPRVLEYDIIYPTDASNATASACRPNELPVDSWNESFVNRSDSPKSTCCSDMEYVSIELYKTDDSTSGLTSTVVNRSGGSGSGMNCTAAAGAGPDNVDVDAVKITEYGSLEFTKIGKSFWFQIVYKNLCFYLVMFIIPLTTLVFVTVRLVATMRLRKRRQGNNNANGGGSGTNSSSNGNGKTRSAENGDDFGKRSSSTVPAQALNRRQQSRDDSVTVVLIIIIVVFIVCQTPTMFQRLLLAHIGIKGLVCGHPYYYVEQVADYLAIFNSCVNFVVYVVFAPHFRRILAVDVLRMRRCCRRRRCWTGDAGETNGGRGCAAVGRGHRGGGRQAVLLMCGAATDGAGGGAVGGKTGCRYSTGSSETGRGGRGERL